MNTENRIVRAVELVTALSYQGNVKLEVLLDSGRLYQSVFTYTREDAQELTSRFLKEGISTLTLKQLWEFSGRQW